MRKLTITALAAMLALAGNLATAQDKDKDGKAPGLKPVVTVNGAAIPKARADALVAEQVAQGAQDGEELRGRVREELVRREILAQEARRKGLDKKLDVMAQMELARQAVLIRAALQDYVRVNPVTDEAVKKEYEGIVARLGTKEYKSRHILLEKEEDAKAVIAKLKAGEKFEELAKQSKDPGSKDNGGDLGWASPSTYVKPFAEALAKLQKGQTTQEPVKSEFGYHVIQLEDVRDAKFPTFEEAKPGLTQRIQQQMVEKYMMDLRAKAKVE